jgi:hypothetical protein
MVENLSSISKGFFTNHFQHPVFQTCSNITFSCCDMLGKILIFDTFEHIK